MKSIVYQSLRDVFHFDTTRALHDARVDNALVRDHPMLALVQQREMLVEPPCDVIRVENRDFCRERKALSTHQSDISQGDRKNARASPRSGRHGTYRVLSGKLDHRMSWQERHEVLSDSDRTHSRSSAAVRNAERLMKIQVT